MQDEDSRRLRDRYRTERDKRIQAGGRRDVADLSGPLERYLEDPHTPFRPREGLRTEVDVLVVGAGMSGLVTGARLRQAGLDDVMLVDAAGDVGGVWYWNRYPGARCDVESLIYLPFLEEVGTLPTERYATASEIRGHLTALADHFGLRKRALFHTRVLGMTWHEHDAAWQVGTDRGDQIRARHVVIANGPLSMPKLPDVPGIKDMTCHAFHTSRWDYTYTGGGPDAPMTGLADKVVGVVGTGATAIQCVPPLAESAAHLYIFQRTPSTVARRDNGPVDVAAVESWKPGWQWERVQNFSAVLNGLPVRQDLVGDGWTELYRDVLFRPEFSTLPPDQAREARAHADLRRMDGIRARVSATVRDQSVAELLKPYYDYFCKRPGFHDEYLGVFNRPDVTLVDAARGGLQEISGNRLRVDGSDYEVDCLIFATGFEWNTLYVHKIGFDPVGREGVSLGEKWRNGPRTLHGVMTNGFPNLFIIPVPNSQSVVTENFAHSIQENAGHIAHIIAATAGQGMAAVEVTAEAEDQWCRIILQRRRDDAAFLEACTPGRSNSEGHPELRSPLSSNFGGDVFEFFRLLADWRDEGALPGLHLSPR
ncbi:flavin-containing monooxygenase [Streptomyces sp. NPDC004227]